MSEEVEPSTKEVKALIAGLYAAGVTLHIGVDGAICYRGRRSVLTPEVMDKLRWWRWEVIAQLERLYSAHESGKLLTTQALAKAQASVRAARK